MSLQHPFGELLAHFRARKPGLSQNRLAELSGYAPAIAVEFARKALMSEVRPTFAEIDEATANLPAS